MDPVLLVGLIGGGSAIVASIGAQVIGAWVFRRTEKQRLKREDAIREEDREDRQSVRFDENKRAAFVRYLQIRNEYQRICRRLYLERHLPERVQRLSDRARYAGSDLEALIEEIGLIDPDVYAVISLNLNIDIREVDPKDLDGLEDWFVDEGIDIVNIRQAMQESLAIASKKRLDHNQPQLNEEM